MLVGVYGTSISYGFEFAVLGGKAGLRHPFDQLVVAAAVGDDLGDAEDFQAPLFREILQVVHAGHGAVVVHDLANDARGIHARNFAKVYDGFGVTRPRQHAAGVVAEGEQVSGPGHLVRRGLRVDQSLDRSGPVMGGDSGGRAFVVVDGHRKGGLVF